MFRKVDFACMVSWKSWLFNVELLLLTLKIIWYNLHSKINRDKLCFMIPTTFFFSVHFFLTWKLTLTFEAFCWTAWIQTLDSLYWTPLCHGGDILLVLRLCRMPESSVLEEPSAFIFWSKHGGSRFFWNSGNFFPQTAPRYVRHTYPCTLCLKKLTSHTCIMMLSVQYNSFNPAIAWPDMFRIIKYSGLSDWLKFL
jgi:hypothetical protein